MILDRITMEQLIVLMGVLTELMTVIVVNNTENATRALQLVHDLVFNVIHH